MHAHHSCKCDIVSSSFPQACCCMHITPASVLLCGVVCGVMVRVVGQPHELGRHWVRVGVEFPTPEAAVAATATPEARRALEVSFNTALASLRMRDGQVGGWALYMAAGLEASGAHGF